MLPLFAQRAGAGAGAGGDAGALAGMMVCFGVFAVIGLAFAVVMIASLWKIFEKAGQPGWAAIVPIYNSYVLTCEIAKKEILWFILQFIPFVGIVAQFIVCIDVAKKFGKETGYGIGLALLPFIFFPLLAFSNAKYQGGRGKGRRDYDDYEDDDYDDEPRPRKPKRRDDYDD